ncbi:hypothetical protein G3A43_07025 [Paraburkholderia aspalathi]|nr:hypothetical protein [Paraburkholderia aspalathi]MBK3780004.1 hypothetical protein [Paraburkholderia aspalathi]
MDFSLLPHDFSETLRGDATHERFKMLISRAFDDDAVGGVCGHRWHATNLSPDHPITPVLRRFLHPEYVELTQYNRVIIDSGNSAGDSGKLIYHPSIAVATVIKEA